MSASSRSAIRFVDTTLRDGQQCLWATRMTTGMMRPIASTMDQIGFQTIDLMGMIQFDVCVRYLNENPWERIRILRDAFENTPLQIGFRSKSLTGFGLVPQDAINAWVDCLAKSGVGRILAFDGLLEIDNIKDTLLHAKGLGLDTIGALVFCESPVHTDEVYVAKAKELVEKTGLSAVMLKDSGGLLTPKRIRSLVPAMKAAIGDVPLEIHSHGMTGLASIVYLESLDAGADVVQTGIWPLADGSAQPPTQVIAPAVEYMGLQHNLNMERVAQASEYLQKLAKGAARPAGRPLPYDPAHYDHQVPGGMMTNLRSQLAGMKMEHLLPAVLEEAGAVRADLAWPIMVTPFAQLVITQALFNVMNGSRYAVVSDEVKMYVLGYYGRHLGPLNQDAVDRIIGNGSPHVLEQAVEPPPVMPTLRERWPDLDDEQRLLRFMFPESMVDAMSDENLRPWKQTPSLAESVGSLLRSRPRGSRITVTRAGTEISVR